MSVGLDLIHGVLSLGSSGHMGNEMTAFPFMFEVLTLETSSIYDECCKLSLIRWTEHTSPESSQVSRYHSARLRPAPTTKVARRIDSTHSLERASGSESERVSVGDP